MRRLALEIIFATIVAVSLFTGQSHPATVNAFDMKTCLTLKTVTDQIDIPMRYDLKGDELALFNKHFKEQTGEDAPPNVDEIAVFARDGENVFALFIIMSKGCVRSHQVIPLPDFMEVYKGKGS